MAPAHRLAIELSDQRGRSRDFYRYTPNRTEEPKSKTQNYREAV